MQDGTSFGVTVTTGAVGSLSGNLGPQQLFANSPLAPLIQPQNLSEQHFAEKGNDCHRHPKHRSPSIVHQLYCTYEQMPATGPEDGIGWLSARKLWIPEWQVLHKEMQKPSFPEYDSRRCQRILGSNWVRSYFAT